MNRLRGFLTDHPRLAALLLAAVLMMRVAIPAGFMPVAQDGTVLLMPCPGMTPAPAMPMMHMGGMDGMHAMPDPAAPPEDHAKPAMPCAFAAVAMAGLAGVDALLLAIAVAIGLRIAARRPVPRRVVATPYLRPPLRGPPSEAPHRR